MIRYLITISLFLNLMFLHNHSFAKSRILERDILADSWKEYNEGNFDKAEKLFESIINSENTSVSDEANLGLGYTYLKKKKLKAAKGIFLLLFKKGYNRKKMQKAFIDVCITLKDYEALDKNLENFDEDNRKKVKKLIYYEKMTVLPEGSEERYKAAEEMLKTDSDDTFALSVVAWHLYKKREYEKAVEYLNRILAKDSSDSGGVLGLGYSLFHLKRYEEAEKVIISSMPENSEDVLKLIKEIIKKKAVQAEKEKKWDMAEEYYRRLLKLDPKDRFSIVGLALIYIKKGENEKSTELLKRSYKWKEGFSEALSLLLVMDQAGLRKEASITADNFKRSKRIDLKKAASEYYKKKGQPLNDNPKKLYSNAFTPVIDGSAYHRYRSGDAGKSQLNESVIPIRYKGAADFGRQWFFTAKNKLMDSGKKVSKAGSYYRFLNGDKSSASLENKAYVSDFILGVKKENDHKYMIMAGSSPLGGVASATPVFKIKYEYSGNLMGIHRTMVEDSILSYSGLDDPYGDDFWGRVLKNGIFLGKTAGFENFWISLNTQYNFYRGENVQDNENWQIDFAVGKTFAQNPYREYTLGIFATLMHYDKNSNFFTYGHGGYYSPEQMFITGPLFRVKSRLYKKHWYDLQISCGWAREKTADSSYYPLSDNSEASSLSSQALDNYNSTYDGEKNTGISLLLNFEGWKMVTEKFNAGFFFHVNQSQQFDEWRVGFALEYTFRAWKSFWNHESIDERYGLK